MMIELGLFTFNFFTASGAAIIFYAAAAGTALIILEKPKSFLQMKSLEEFS